MTKFPNIMFTENNFVHTTAIYSYCKLNRVHTSSEVLLPIGKHTYSIKEKCFAYRFSWSVQYVKNLA